MNQVTKKTGRIKKITVSLGCIVLIFGLVFLSGPKVRIDESLQPVSLPNDLDNYLSQQEQRFSDIIPGTEKKIIWADETGTQTEFALVYVHGFSATRQETAPLSDQVARELEANLFYTRLTGHGRTGEAMLDGSVNAWLNDTNEAFEIGKRLGKKVIMVGASTGGTAVTWLAAQPGIEALRASILLSPNFAPKDRSAWILTWPWGLRIAELMIGGERHWEADNPAQDRFWTNLYPTAALLPMMGVVKTVTSMDLSRVKDPVLVIYSPHDQIVNPDATVKAFARIGSKRKKLLTFTRAQDPSQHILAGNILSPDSTVEVADKILEFILK